ncbi:NAD(P)H-binding protein [Listeria weihenstephanensis]|uniref:NAD(P)H-binding protein n=1 Tax=Listeria weihenstephanensis TaxID=1006155 RepID=A0A841Z902_9LIST|nr:NAD(P)H-binding protein [Listeria weihenstephanensis]MBC1501339.1 NAD(P)H-binding protein [Listeria weihenstephanensis]
MNIVILGAFGHLGKAVYQLLEPLPDVNLTLFGREKENIEVAPTTKVIFGDATNTEDLERVLQGQDIVFSTLGPFHVETFATPLVETMEKLGVKRLFWTTQFPIRQETVTDENIELAKVFGFDEETERTYVANQQLGAKIIEESSLDYTLLMPHFFKYDNTIEKAILQDDDETVKGDPISIYSLAVVLANLVLQPDRYSRKGVIISASK